MDGWKCTGQVANRVGRSPPSALHAFRWTGVPISVGSGGITLSSGRQSSSAGCRRRRRRRQAAAPCTMAQFRRSVGRSILHTRIDRSPLHATTRASPAGRPPSARVTDGRRAATEPPRAPCIRQSVMRRRQRGVYRLAAQRRRGERRADHWRSSALAAATAAELWADDRYEGCSKPICLRLVYLLPMEPQLQEAIHSPSPQP